jgi:dynein heavy chain
MLLYSKRQEIGDKIAKYSNGIIKLDEANEQVKHMSGESEKNNEEIAKAKQVAEQKEQEIQEQTKHIDKALLELQAKQKIIEAEKIEATNLAAAAEIELGKAMPALEAADAAVDKLESKHIAEMKSVNTPHPDVHMVMMAVMIYLGEKTEWVEIKKVIGKPKFKDNLMTFDKENIPTTRLQKVQKYTRMETF